MSWDDGDEFREAEEKRKREAAFAAQARLVKIQMHWPNFSLEYVATYERAKRLMPIVLKEAMEAEEECQAIRNQMPPNDKEVSDAKRSDQ